MSLLNLEAVTAELLQSSISPILLESLSASGFQRAVVKMGLSEAVCEGVKRPPLRIKQSVNPETSCKENRCQNEVVVMAAWRHWDVGGNDL